MKQRLLTILLLMQIAGLAPADERRLVLLAASRAGQIVVFDPDTLETLGAIQTGRMAESAVASPDGTTLLIAQASPGAAMRCCALYALDLATRRFRFLIEPAMIGIPSADGARIFVNRGNGGIDTFDARTLRRGPTIRAPGVYQLRASPDGRWLFGVTNWSGPSLDIFDLTQDKLVRRLPVPGAASPNGAWLRDRFYLYAFDGRQGRLWRVTSDDTSLPPPVTVVLPDVASGCNQPVFQTLVSTGDRLFVYERFGMKLDRRSSCPGMVPGGIFEIEPSTGKAVSYLAPSLYFMHLAASPDGRELYGIELGPRVETGHVRLMKIDAVSGDVLLQRPLENGIWPSLTTATIPASLIPRGNVQPQGCPSARRIP